MQDVDHLLDVPFVPDLRHMIALVLKILLTCHFRIGTPRYAQLYHTYGITTLLTSHATLGAPFSVKFDFIGKKQVRNTCIMHHPTVYNYIRWRKSQVRITSEIADQSAAETLFLYWDTSKHQWLPLTGSQVNHFLSKYGAFTTRQLRTFRANQLFTQHVKELSMSPSMSMSPKEIVQTSLQAVAGALHHNATTCKRHYINPLLLSAAGS